MGSNPINNNNEPSCRLSWVMGPSPVIPYMKNLYKII